MVISTSQPYELPIQTESGYTLFLPNVGTSLGLLQNPHPDPYAQGTTPLYPVGTKLSRGEQVWRYCYAGDATIAIAVPVESSTTIHSVHERNIAVTSNAAIGATTVYLTGASNFDDTPADEDNEFAEGYFYVNDGTGQGQCRKIRSNEGFGSSGATEFNLYEALTIALVAGNSQVGLSRNPYWMVITSTATLAGIPVGVTSIPITANNYFWSQTGGPCAVVPQTTIALGTAVIIGTTAGKVDDGSAWTAECVIGYPLTPAKAGTEEMLVFLTLDS